MAAEKGDSGAEAVALEIGTYMGKVQKKKKKKLNKNKSIKLTRTIYKYL